MEDYRSFCVRERLVGKTTGEASARLTLVLSCSSCDECQQCLGSLKVFSRNDRERRGGHKCKEEGEALARRVGRRDDQLVREALVEAPALQGALDMRAEVSGRR